MKRIIVGGDYTSAATAALRWAVGEAARTGSCVAVVHAFDASGRVDPARERGLDRARREARYRTQSWVVEVLGELNTRVPVIVSTPDGPVEQALLAAAPGAQMVVIGRSDGGRHRDLASVLARSCDCPVMTVTGEFEEMSSA